jgi:anaerobic selenocysteine-containing dehydrogenase
MPKGLEHFALIRLANIFGSPNVVAVQDVCHAPREISGLHTCGFYPVTDYHYRSALVLLWGSNSTSTNEEGEICRPLLSQLRQGTELIVVDPRRTALAAKARYWLPLKPGTDHALALAFLHVITTEALFDEAFVRDWTHGFEQLTAHVRAYSPEATAPVTGVAADLVRQAARAYAQAKPAALGWGNPIEQTARAFDAARALICLMAICGNLDVPGGNIQANEPNISPLGRFVRADLIPDKRRNMIHAHWQAIPRLMTVPPAHFRKAVLEGEPYPVTAAYVQCSNPVMAWADSQLTYKALQKLDFLAVSDLVMTPTAALADIVLPAATHFEFDDIGHYGLGHGIVLARPAIVPPPGECRPDMAIINDLGLKMTLPELWFDPWQAMLDEVLAPAGFTYARFAEQGYLKGEQRFTQYRQAGFKTPTGKVELLLSRSAKFNLPPLPSADIEPQAPDPEFPLILTSAKSRYYLHSSYRWLPSLRRGNPRPTAALNPQTAAAFGVDDGASIIIETAHGSIVQTARLTTTVRPGVVCAAYGWWEGSTPENGLPEWRAANYNMLTSAEGIGREFGTPNLKGLRCRLRPAVS